MIPFDLQGLIAAEGGDAAWIELLNGLTSSVVADGTNQIQMGDEPSFDIPWEYDYVGVPFRPKRWSGRSRTSTTPTAPPVWPATTTSEP